MGHSSATLADERRTHRGSAHMSSLETDSWGVRGEKSARRTHWEASLCDSQRQSLAAASAEGEAGLGAGGAASSHWALGAWGTARLQGRGLYTLRDCHGGLVSPGCISPQN